MSALSVAVIIHSCMHACARRFVIAALRACHCLMILRLRRRQQTELRSLLLSCAYETLQMMIVNHHAMRPCLDELHCRCIADPP